jgi:hypothetical protein
VMSTSPSTTSAGAPKFSRTSPVTVRSMPSYAPAGTETAARPRRWPRRPRQPACSRPRRRSPRIRRRPARHRPRSRCSSPSGSAVSDRMRRVQRAREPPALPQLSYARHPPVRPSTHDHDTRVCAARTLLDRLPGAAWCARCHRPGIRP